MVSLLVVARVGVLGESCVGVGGLSDDESDEGSVGVAGARSSKTGDPICAIGDDGDPGLSDEAGDLSGDEKDKLAHESARLFYWFRIAEILKFGDVSCSETRRRRTTLH